MFAFVVFLFVMYKIGITLADIWTYLRKFFGFAILSTNSKIREKLRNRIEDVLRSRTMKGIMAVIPRRSR